MMYSTIYTGKSLIILDHDKVALKEALYMALICFTNESLKSPVQAIALEVYFATRTTRK